MSTPYGPGDLNAPNDRFGGNGMVAAPHNGGYGGYQYSPDVSQQTLNYPPPHHSQAPSYLTYSSTALKNEPDVNVRYISRTPSPTPSEAETLSRKGVIDWNKLMSWKYWIRKEWICTFVCCCMKLGDITVLSSRVLCYSRHSIYLGHSYLCVRQANRTFFKANCSEDSKVSNRMIFCTSHIIAP